MDVEMFLPGPRGETIELPVWLKLKLNRELSFNYVNLERKWERYFISHRCGYLCERRAHHSHICQWCGVAVCRMAQWPTPCTSAAKILVSYYTHPRDRTCERWVCECVCLRVLCFFPKITLCHRNLWFGGGVGRQEEGTVANTSRNSDNLFTASSLHTTKCRGVTDPAMKFIKVLHFNQHCIF